MRVNEGKAIGVWVAVIVATLTGASGVLWYLHIEDCHHREDYCESEMFPSRNSMERDIDAGIKLDAFERKYGQPEPHLEQPYVLYFKTGGIDVEELPNGKLEVVTTYVGAA